MKLSKDLIFVEHDNKFLAYNFFINKAVLINKETYLNILKLKKFEISIKHFLNLLTTNEIKYLIKNGVIYNDIEEYKKMDYSIKLLNRNPKVELSIAYFHITQRCNLRCSYCYNKCNLNKPDKLTTEQIRICIKRLYEKGVKTIVFTGGEATIRKDILELFKYCKSLGININLLTNGTNLLKKIDLFEYLDFAIVSLDTIKKENNQRLGLNIEKLIKELKIISSKYKNKIAVRSVVSKFNINDLEITKNIIEKELNIPFISAVFIPNSVNEIKYMVNYKDIEPDCGSQNFSGNICGATYKIIAIDSNGDLFPCQCLIKQKYKVGNLLDDDWFEKLEEHSITKGFKKRTVLDIDICKNCEYKYLCGGGCRAISDNLYKNFNSFIECICPFQKDIAKNKLISLIKNYG